MDNEVDRISIVAGSLKACFVALLCRIVGTPLITEGGCECEGRLLRTLRCRRGRPHISASRRLSMKSTSIAVTSPVTLVIIGATRTFYFSQKQQRVNKTRHLRVFQVTVAAAPDPECSLATSTPALYNKS